jgi:hypothetical protein
MEGMVNNLLQGFGLCLITPLALYAVIKVFLAIIEGK